LFGLIFQIGRACLDADLTRKMDNMETQITPTNEQLASFDQRLTAVDRSVAALTVEVAVLSKTAVTKDDIVQVKSDVARIDATLASLQQNCATKADLALLETRITKWMIATLVGVAALNSTLVLLVVKLLQR
jgi:septal ring factor EnvC (AmiA/AmiB activator)